MKIKNTTSEMYYNSNLSVYMRFLIILGILFYLFFFNTDGRDKSYDVIIFFIVLVWIAVEIFIISKSIISRKKTVKPDILSYDINSDNITFFYKDGKHVVTYDNISEVSLIINTFTGTNGKAAVYTCISDILICFKLKDNSEINVTAYSPTLIGSLKILYNIIPCLQFLSKFNISYKGSGDKSYISNKINEFCRTGKKSWF